MCISQSQSNRGHTTIVLLLASCTFRARFRLHLLLLFYGSLPFVPFLLLLHTSETMLGKWEHTIDLDDVLRPFANNHVGVYRDVAVVILAFVDVNR